MAQDVREVAAGLAEAKGVLLLPIVGEGPREREPADLAHRHGVEAGAEAVGLCWGGKACGVVVVRGVSYHIK
jgi:hypothetical protein